MSEEKVHEKNTWAEGPATVPCQIPEPWLRQLLESLSWVYTARGERPHGPCGGKGAGLQLRVFHSLNLYCDLGWVISPSVPLCQRWEPLLGQDRPSLMLMVTFRLYLLQCQEQSLMWLLHPVHRPYSLADASLQAPWRPRKVYSGEQRQFSVRIALPVECSGL